MPSYLIDIEHLPTDQVFSYHHGEENLHFNATLLARLHKQMPDEFRRITMDIDHAIYDLCMKYRGIEEHRVVGLLPRNLREPGYGAVFEDGRFTVIDGHHRLVRRYRGGVRVMDFFVAPPPIWRACLVPYTAEESAMVMTGVPPRVEHPTDIASRVTVHPNE